jgi:hypothetical protein
VTLAPSWSSPGPCDCASSHLGSTGNNRRWLPRSQETKVQSVSKEQKRYTCAWLFYPYSPGYSQSWGFPTALTFKNWNQKSNPINILFKKKWWVNLVQQS